MLELVDFISFISALGVIITIVITVFNNKQHKLTIITSQRITKYNQIGGAAQVFLEC